MQFFSKKKDINGTLKQNWWDYFLMAITGWEQRRKIRALRFVLLARRLLQACCGFLLCWPVYPRHIVITVACLLQDKLIRVKSAGFINRACLFKRTYLHQRSETHAGRRNRCCVGVQHLTDGQVLGPFSSSVLASVGFYVQFHDKAEQKHAETYQKANQLEDPSW